MKKEWFVLACVFCTAAISACVEPARGRYPEALLDEAKRLLAERAEIVKANDQKRVDAWRLAVGRTIDGLMAK